MVANSIKHSSCTQTTPSLPDRQRTTALSFSEDAAGPEKSMKLPYPSVLHSYPQQKEAFRGLPAPTAPA
jgi:hypothetical protein